MRLCIPNAALGEAVTPMEGYGFTNLVGFIDNTTETVAVLGFLMLQNWYFWTSATIYENLQRIFISYSERCIQALNLRAQITHAQKR